MWSGREDHAFPPPAIIEIITAMQDAAQRFFAHINGDSKNIVFHYNDPGLFTGRAKEISMAISRLREAKMLVSHASISKMLEKMKVSDTNPSDMVPMQQPEGDVYDALNEIREERNMRMYRTMSRELKILLAAGKPSMEIYKFMQAHQGQYIDNDKKDQPIHQQVEKIIEEIHQRQEGIIGGGLSWGCRHTDEKVGLIEKSQLILVAGRTSMGKSTYIASLVRHLLKVYWSEVYIIWVTPESSPKDAILRMVSGMVYKSVSAILSSGTPLSAADLQKAEKAISFFSEAPLEITSEKISTQAFEERIRDAKRKYPERHVIGIYDTVQKAVPKGKDSTRAIREASAHFEEIKNSFECSIFEVAQIRRLAEEPYIPTMEDLKDSGSLEEDADKVALMYRPEYYNYDVFPQGEDQSEPIPARGKVGIIWAKSRNSEVGMIIHNHNLAFNTIYPVKPFNEIKIWDQKSLEEGLKG